jgi:hypothetical protein
VVQRSYNRYTSYWKRHWTLKASYFEKLQVN